MLRTCMRVQVCVCVCGCEHTQYVCLCGCVVRKEDCSPAVIVQPGAACLHLLLAGAALQVEDVPALQHSLAHGLMLAEHEWPHATQGLGGTWHLIRPAKYTGDGLWCLQHTLYAHTVFVYA